jgi:ribosomal protein L37AE/L43A
VTEFLIFIITTTPTCSVKRQATGVWKCLRCKKVMAGGAYVLR